MIGDWVKIKTYGVSDKFERTEAYMYVKVAEIGCGLITVEYNNDIKEPYRICENTEIEPIPLTSEILEKNGFEKWDDGWCIYDQESTGIEVAWVGTILKIEGQCGNLELPDVMYVHQLQHALRLCGIEKEIEL